MSGDEDFFGAKFADGEGVDAVGVGRIDGALGVGGPGGFEDSVG